MKFVVAFILGIVSGVFLLLFGYVANPFAGAPSLSPLAADDGQMINLNFSNVPAQSILLTNDEGSRIDAVPEGVQRLWEPTISDTQVLVTRLTDSRGQPAGIGIKMSTPSESTRLFKSMVLVDSVWHIYLPGRGLLGVYQQENFWPYLRDLLIPALRSSGKSWRGNWIRNMTAGPGPLGTARVFGLGGLFAGTEGEAVETVSARAYSAVLGPVSMTSTLNISMQPEPQSTADRFD